MKVKRTKMRYEHTVKRNEQKAAGAFDGRFKQRVIKDKKKQAKREWARLKSQIDINQKLKHMNYSKRDLQQLDTIEQAWDGSELKIEENNIKVWLTQPEHRQYDGDYTIETRVNGKWEQQPCWFEQAKQQPQI